MILKFLFKCHEISRLQPGRIKLVGKELLSKVGSQNVDSTSNLVEQSRMSEPKCWDHGSCVSFGHLVNTSANWMTDWNHS